MEASSGIERARILSTGQFGIGTTTPGAKLEVFNSGGTVFNVLGSLGQLFSVTDNLSGEIFAVADISGVPIMSINSNGSIKFGSYSGTNQTGTPTYMLGTTATGGVVKVLGADIPGVPGGSGTLRTIPMWTPDGDTLGDSNVKQDSTGNIGIGTGTITSPPQDIGLTIQSTTSTSRLILKNSSTGVGANDGFRLGAVGINVEFEAKDSGDFQFYTTGTQVVTINSSGNFGIGDTLPVVKLQVSTNSPTNNVATLIGDGWVGNDLYHKEGGFLLISGTSQAGTQTGAGIAFQTRNNANTNYWKSSVIMDRDGAMRFTLGGAGTSAGSEDFTILSNGKVGVGITGPTANLQVAGTTTYNSDAAQALRVCDAADVSKGIHIGYDTTQDAGVIQAGDFGVIYKDLVLNPNAGNVGIGTISPNNKLDVNGDVFINSNYTANTAAQDLTIGKTTTGDHGLTIVTSNANTAGIFFADNNNNDAGRIKYQHSNNSMRFDTNRSEAMRINFNGNIAIGTTADTYRLQVEQNSTGLLSRFHNTNADGQGLLIRAGNVSSATRIIQLASQNDTKVMTVNSNGRVGIGTVNPTAVLSVVGTANFTGLVSGITPVAAANFVTKAYVDGSGGGTGPFLPLAGGTLIGPVDFGASAAGVDVGFYGNAAGEQMFWDASESRLTINHDTDDSGLDVFTVASAAMTQPQLRVGRDLNQYWGVYTEDRNAHLVHRQDETTGTMTTRFDQWDSNTADNNAQWQWRSGNGSGGAMSIALTLSQAGDAIFSGNVTTGASLISSNIIINQITSATANGNINIRNNAGANIVLFNNNLSSTFTGAISTTYVTSGGFFTDGFVTWNGAQFNRPGAAIEFQFAGSTNSLVKFGSNGSNPVVINANTGKVTGAATLAADGVSTLTTKSYVDGLVTGVPVYRGTWDARTQAEGGLAGDGGNINLRLAANKILGNYYIVETAGSATPNGAGTEPDSWNVGDWCIFSDVTSGTGTDLWQRIDNSSVVSGAGTGQKVTKWAGTGPSETLTDGPITFSSSNNDSSFAGNVTSNTRFEINSVGVGIIGAISNTANDLNIFSTSSGHNGLRFHVSGILPTNNAGTIVDADANLGEANYRFKDGYFSGTVTATNFIGGSGAFLPLAGGTMLGDIQFNEHSAKFNQSGVRSWEIQ